MGKQLSGTSRFKPALRASTALALAIGLAGPTTAQDDDTETTAKKPVFLGTITLFADRIGRALTDVPGHISVVGEDELKDRNVQTLEDLLRYIPGVTPVRQVSGADPFGGQTGIRIRGVEGNRVQMVVDGGRIPERIIDGSRDYLDFGFTKQVDVVRGPASVLWGADAMGGVLGLETIDPEDLLQGRERGGQITLGYGELTDATNLSVAFAQRFGEDWSLLVARSRGIDHEQELTKADPTGGRWPCARAIQFGAVDCGHFNPLDRTSDRTLAKLVWDISDTQSLKFTFDKLDRLSEIDNRNAEGRRRGGPHRPGRRRHRPGRLAGADRRRDRAAGGSGDDRGAAARRPRPGLPARAPCRGCAGPRAAPGVPAARGHRHIADRPAGRVVAPRGQPFPLLRGREDRGGTGPSLDDRPRHREGRKPGRGLLVAWLTGS